MDVRNQDTESTATPTTQTPETLHTSSEGIQAPEIKIDDQYLEETRSKNKTLIAALAAVGALLLICGGYYIYKTQFGDGAPVAVVNGFKIARTEFNNHVAEFTQAAALQGADTNDPIVKSDIETQVIDMLVSNTLLTEAAKAKGFTADDEKIQETYDLLVARAGSEETLKAELAKLKLSEAKLRQNIADQVMVNAFLEAETDIENVQVSEEDVRAQYDTYAQSGVTIPPFDEVRDFIENDLIKMKQSEIINQVIATLREGATIEINI